MLWQTISLHKPLMFAAHNKFTVVLHFSNTERMYCYCKYWQFAKTLLFDIFQQYWYDKSYYYYKCWPLIFAGHTKFTIVLYFSNTESMYCYCKYWQFAKTLLWLYISAILIEATTIVNFSSVQTIISFYISLQYIKNELLL